MAAHVTYPAEGDEAIVRGDPETIITLIAVLGVPQDISEWTWRCHVRTKFDSTEPLSVCEDFEVVTPADLPSLFADIDIDLTGYEDTPCVLLAHFTGEQSALWKDGNVSDIEQLTPAKKTWVIVDRLRVDKDASHTEELP